MAVCKKNIFIQNNEVYFFSLIMKRKESIKINNDSNNITANCKKNIFIKRTKTNKVNYKFYS